MNSFITLVFTAAALTACATPAQTETNPNATTVEVLAPKPISAPTK